ncbi:MAG: NAD(P)H-hydrate dehydratase [Candidatus Stahlbacteria bacterium]|nr:NAD(P)H-hydrate dehydratase [Candidatus Stahlbacteria bacterium]
MKLVTAKEMQEIDKKAIEELGIPGPVLMELAGIGLFNIIQEEFMPKTENRKPKTEIGIVCGKGNNGGDGFVLARHLLNIEAKRKSRSGGDEISAEVFLLGKVNEITGDARLNLNILLKAGYKVTEITTPKDVNLFKEKCVGTRHSMSLLVDGIFGTGFKGKVEGIAEQIINIMNGSGIPILAIDVPSGINATTGEVEGACIRAAFTGTMCLPKRGLFLYPGKDYAGRVSVIDIGVPPYLWKHINLELIGLKNLLPYRPDNSNKGTFGRVFILAGSTGMTGAAALTSISALKIGAGLVRLGIPESLNSILEAKATEVITVPLPETSEGTITIEAMDKILDEINKSTVVIIGPGLSTHDKTKSLIQKLVPKIDLPMVIDADGLNNLNLDLLKKIKAPVIITPHPGELSRIIGMSIPEIQKARIDIAKKFAKELNLILVLKGAPTIIASKDKCYLNPIYTSALAKAGSGDVLTGIIGGLLAQGLSPIDAARLGVYLHGRAGKIASEKLTNYCVLASDVVEVIPEVIREIENIGL